jgi:hypothetical protein
MAVVPALEAAGELAGEGVEADEIDRYVEAFAGLASALTPAD